MAYAYAACEYAVAAGAAFRRSSALMFAAFNEVLDSEEMFVHLLRWSREERIVP